MSRLRDGVELAQAQSEIASFTARQVQADTATRRTHRLSAARARSAQSRRPQPAAAAVRLRRARLLRRVRQRRRAVRRARAAAPSRIRDASRTGRIAGAPVPTDDHRKRRALDDQRDGRRRIRVWHRHRVQGDWRPRHSTRGRCADWLARRRVWICRRPTRGRRVRSAAGASGGRTWSRARIEGRAQHDGSRRATIARLDRHGANRAHRQPSHRRGAADSHEHEACEHRSRLRDGQRHGRDGDDRDAELVPPFHTQVLERVAALPGVSHAAFAWGVPLTGNKWPGIIEFMGRPDLGQVSFPLRSSPPTISP